MCIINGDKITLSAGTYFENVSVNKEVEIEGAGQGLTIVRPAISDPTNGTLASPIFLVKSSNVKIHHLTADGKNDAITGVGDIDASSGIVTDFNAFDCTNLEVHHVTVKDVYRRGIQPALFVLPTKNSK